MPATMSAEACGQCGERTATIRVWLPPNEPGQPELPVRKCRGCWVAFLQRVQAAIVLGDEEPYRAASLPSHLTGDLVARETIASKMLADMGVADEISVTSNHAEGSMTFHSRRHGPITRVFPYAPGLLSRECVQRTVNEIRREETLCRRA